MSKDNEAKVFVAEDLELDIETEDAEQFNEIIGYTNVDQSDEYYDQTKKGMIFLLRRLLDKISHSNDLRVSKRVVEEIIKELDSVIGAQVDEILHHEEFQKTESTWKQLKFLVDRTDFSENITVNVLNISKEELLDDFEDNIETINSGLYQHVYVDEFGQYGGKPYGAIIGGYEFDKTPDDIELMKRLSSVSAMAHAPFIGNLGAKFFDLNSFEELNQIKDLESEMEGIKYKNWNAFREYDDSRNIGMCLPRFMLREPYGENNPIRKFGYTEVTHGDSNKYLWGYASFAFATRLSDSFAKYRWCPNIIGPQSGGQVEELSTHVIEKGGLQDSYGPTETIISDRMEYALSELGAIALAVRKGADKACFFSASSVQKGKYFGNDEDSKIKEMNYKLGTELPYLFVINRLAHYLKVMQRENLGSWKSRSEIEDELNKWIRQYVSDQENPSPAIRSQRPLRKAKISVIEDPSLGAGWYKIDLSVTPHFKFMGANFTLFLSSAVEGGE